MGNIRQKARRTQCWCILVHPAKPRDSPDAEKALFQPKGFKSGKRPMGFQLKVKIQSQQKAYLSKPVKSPKGLKAIKGPKCVQSQSKAKHTIQDQERPC